MLIINLIKINENLKSSNWFIALKIIAIIKINYKIALYKYEKFNN